MKMTQLLFQTDSTLKEFEATVTSIDGNTVYLDKTVFYAQSGGQPWDTGKITSNGKKANVVSVRKTENGIAHELDQNPFSVGEQIHGIIDWPRRYKLMRSHTAAHVIGAVLFKQKEALVTGKNLDIDKSHIDFSLETFDKALLTSIVEEANTLVVAGADVTWYFLPKEEAFKIPNIVRLAARMPPDIPELRIVEIKGIDIEVCGGTHVKNIREIGKIEIIELENKGKGKKRLYYTVRP